MRKNGASGRSNAVQPALAVPPSAEVKQFTEILTLERGVLLGVLLFLGGLAGSTYAVTSWGHIAFGPVDPVSLMRAAIPSATALATRLEVLFGSFFFAMLRIAASDQTGRQASPTQATL